MAGTLVQGALFTVMVVRAAMLRDPAFEEELAKQVERSPRFFLNAPVVLDLKGSEADAFVTPEEFAEARRVLRGQTLMLVGVQNALPQQIAAAAAADLAGFAPNATQPSRRRAAEAEAEPPEPAAAPAAPPPATVAPRTRLVTQPVRSGTQIYARGGDLVVTAAVSPGAELVADGNIHVYGVLRGRALAGASGDAGARIFCSRFEAELVSIAGHYLVSEQLPPEQQGFPVQIALIDDQLTITRN
ncbi:MAG TPA: septum site-determining protein MinC [Stellaceae bacterium]|nr:septum site-determining protein MinC [Stellaceae bacterium]